MNMTEMYVKIKGIIIILTNTNQPAILYIIQNTYNKEHNCTQKKI